MASLPPAINPIPEVAVTATHSDVKPESGVHKRRRGGPGRPVGTKNKPKPPVFVPTPENLQSHVFEIASGSDIIKSLANFAHRRQRGVCVISGTGSVANVTIRQPGGGTGTMRGTFEISSLSGSFLPPPAPPSATGLTVYVDAGRGRVSGGRAVSPLIASGTVVIMASSFGNISYERLPPLEPENGNPNPNPNPSQDQRGGLPGSGLVLTIVPLPQTNIWGT